MINIRFNVQLDKKTPLECVSPVSTCCDTCGKQTNSKNTKINVRLFQRETWSWDRGDNHCNLQSHIIAKYEDIPKEAEGGKKEATCKRTAQGTSRKPRIQQNLGMPNSNCNSYKVRPSQNKGNKQGGWHIQVALRRQPPGPALRERAQEVSVITLLSDACDTLLSCVLFACCKHSYNWFFDP